MTTTTTEAAEALEPGAPDGDEPKAEAPRRPRRQWSKTRVIVPFAVFLALVIVTIVAVSIETPSPSDPEYLNPAATGADGSSVLAERLRAQGVAVDVVTGVDAALQAANAPDTTLFVPAPDYLRFDQVLQFADLPRETRVVLVRPGALSLSGMTGLTVTESRIATGTVEPACNLPVPAAAGNAEVFRDRYGYGDDTFSDPGAPAPTSCYRGSLVSVPAGPYMPGVTLVGAPDPFTNGRIDAAGNSALAVGLLSGTKHLVWLDRHAPEPKPKSTNKGKTTPYDPPPASSPDNPLYKAFPAWMWAALIGLLTVFVLAALARGRRIGPPAAEPLPVQVPAAETVYGRARLYRRGESREAAMRAMREGALSRLLPAVGLSAKAEPAQVVATVAARSGWDPQRVRTVLYGPEPVGDQDLLDSIHALDSLEYAVLGDRYHERHHT